MLKACDDLDAAIAYCLTRLRKIGASVLTVPIDGYMTAARISTELPAVSELRCFEDSGVTRPPRVDSG